MHAPLFLFSLIPFLASSASSSSPSTLLEFDPPLLRLNDDRVQPTTFRVRLRQLPRAPTSLYFESPNLRFSLCNLRFSPRTYNQWQAIEVRGLPYFVDADRGVKELVQMKMSCPEGGDGWHGRNWTMEVERPDAKGATCTSNGDPHVTTFDGKYYSYQGLGCFYMMKSPALTVQTLTDTWSNGATVSVATAIRFGRAHFIVDARATDPGQRLTQLSGTAPGVDVLIGDSREEFRFRFADGSNLVINYHGASPRNYLDHTLSVPAHYRQKTQGWCGTFNANQADDWTAADGTVKTEMNACADTWKVPASDDIFTCKDRCPDAVQALQEQQIKPCDMCRIPTNLDGAGVYRDPDVSYKQWKGQRGTYARPPPSYEGKPRHLTPRPMQDAGFRQRAKAACEAAFNLPDLHKLVPTTPYLNSCVSDCELTGTLEMVDPKKSAYLTHVHQTVSPILATTSYTGHAPNKALAPVVAICKKAAVQLGLGTSQCPRNCSGHGVCRKCGCKCAAGWTGPDCSTRLDAYGIPVVHGGRAAQQSVYSRPPIRPMGGFRDDYDDDEDMPRPAFGGPRPRPDMPMSMRPHPFGSKMLNSPTTWVEQEQPDFHDEDDGNMRAHGGPTGDEDPFLQEEERDDEN